MQLVLTTASNVQMDLSISADQMLAMRLCAELGRVVCPIHSPPARATLKWFAHMDDSHAEVVVLIKRDETTNGLPDITVESSPVVFEFRNQVLLQMVGSSIAALLQHSRHSARAPSRQRSRCGV